MNFGVVVTAAILAMVAGAIIWAEFKQGQEIDSAIKSTAESAQLQYGLGLHRAYLSGTYRDRQLTLEVRSVYMPRTKGIHIRAAARLANPIDAYLSVDCDAFRIGRLWAKVPAMPQSSSDFSDICSVESRPKEYGDWVMSSDKIRRALQELCPCTLTVSDAHVHLSHAVNARLESPTNEQLLAFMDTVCAIAGRCDSYDRAESRQVDSDSHSP